jgi:hypothetical protein
MNMTQTQPTMELTVALAASETTGRGRSETQQRQGGRKPIWVLVLVGLYALALIGALGILTFQMAAGERECKFVWAVSTAFFLVSQVSLLWVPVRLARRRPVHRRTLWFPLMISGALFALLVLVLGWAAGARLGEILEDRLVSTDYYEDVWFLAPLALAVGSWIAWVASYYRLSATRNPQSIALTLHRRLLQGSLLLLLLSGAALALPHNWGFAFAFSGSHFHLPFTFWIFVALGTGLYIGSLVMFLALAPAAAMLYVRRCMDVPLTSENNPPPATKERGGLAWSILAGTVAALFLLLFLVR